MYQRIGIRRVKPVSSRFETLRKQLRSQKKADAQGDSHIFISKQICQQIN